jgi:FkbM family methyltransferase
MRTWLKKVKAAVWPVLVRRLPFGVQASYSQFGEDMILSWLFRHYRGRPGVYVDVGAYHPVVFSNTYGLYCRGWRGVNVEPRPGALEDFRIFRPRDVNLRLCITPAPAADATLFVFEEAIHNTIDPADAEESMAAGRKLVARQTVPAATLTAVLDAHLPPGSPLDLLSIDVEGVDEAILMSNDWSRHSPLVIIFEARGNPYTKVPDLPIVKYLDGVGYDVVAKCGESIVLRHREQWRASYARREAAP